MLALARDVVEDQDAVGGPGGRWMGNNKKKWWVPWPTFGAAAIWYMGWPTRGREESEGSRVYKSAGDGHHVEDQEIDWAANRIWDLVHEWGDKAWNAEIDVHLMATLPPCASTCRPNYLFHVWLDKLLAAADRKLPGAYGGSTGITLKLWVWVIEPDPRYEQYGSLLNPLGIQYGEEDLALWAHIPWEVILS
jgi:hypothetical protein